MSVAVTLTRLLRVAAAYLIGERSGELRRSCGHAVTTHNPTDSPDTGLIGGRGVGGVSTVAGRPAAGP